MGQVTIRSEDIKFTCTVEEGRETCHSDSDHRTESSIIDDRVPPKYFVVYDRGSRPKLYTTRPLKAPVELVLKHIIIEEVGDDFRIALGEGVPVQWPSKWIYITCHSRGLAEYCIELLEMGEWERVAEKAKVRTL